MDAGPHIDPATTSTKANRATAVARHTTTGLNPAMARVVREGTSRRRDSIHLATTTPGKLPSCGKSSPDNATWKLRGTVIHLDTSSVGVNPMQAPSFPPPSGPSPRTFSPPLRTRHPSTSPTADSDSFNPSLYTSARPPTDRSTALRPSIPRPRRRTTAVLSVLSMYRQEKGAVCEY
jgi:hypothetical protein